MDNNLPNTQLDDQKMENLRKRTKLSKYIMIAGGVCLGIVVLMILLNGGTAEGRRGAEAHCEQLCTERARQGDGSAGYI